jgi:hypothetical protein
MQLQLFRWHSLSQSPSQECPLWTKLGVGRTSKMSSTETCKLVSAKNVHFTDMMHSHTCHYCALFCTVKHTPWYWYVGTTIAWSRTSIKLLMNIPETTFRNQEGWGEGMLMKVCMRPWVQFREEMHSYLQCNTKWTSSVSLPANLNKKKECVL